MTGYTENLHTYVKASFSYFAAEFSVSTDYKRTEDELKKTEKVSFSNSATCELYELNGQAFDYPKLNADFKMGLIHSYENNDWQLFLYTYGTHFLQSARLGGRMSVKSLIEKEDYSKLVSTNFNFQVGAKFNFFKIQGNTQAGTETEKKTAEQFARYTSSYQVYYLGGEPQKGDDSYAWQKTVRERPAPISY